MGTLLGLALLGWYLLAALPVAPILMPEGGLDPSWRWALNLFADHFEFGRDLIFTYGPWGYLDHPMFVGSHALAGQLMALALHLATVALATRVFLKTRSVLTLAVFLVSFVAVSGTVDYRAVAVLGLTAAVALEVRSGALAVAGICAAPSLIFMKFTGGISAAAITAVALVLWAVEQRSLRPLLAGAALYLISLGVCSVLALGGLTRFPAFLRGSLELASGYSEAMALPGALLFVGAALSLMLATLAVAIALVRRRTASARPLLLMAFPCLFAFKHSFVRQDWGHITLVFVMLIAASSITALLSQSGTERTFSVGLCLLAIVTLIALLPPPLVQVGARIFAAMGSGSSTVAALDLYRHFGEGRARFEAATPGALRDDRLSDIWRERIGQSTVMVVPVEVAICAANALACVPYPTVQMYSTYTSALDGWSAERIAASPPSWIVSETLAIDGRQMLWDAPRVWRTLLAGWAPVEVAPGSANRILLQRRGHPLELHETALATQSAALGSWIPVPSTSPWLQAQLSLPQTLLGRLRTLLFRPAQTWVELRRRSGAMASVRLIVDTAADGIWLQATPVNAGDLAAWFNGGVSADPVVAFRLTSAAPSDHAERYAVRWTQLAEEAGPAPN